MTWWRSRRRAVRRQWARFRAAPGPLRDFYDHPWPDLARDWREHAYLALDFETTGTEAGRHEILSAGYVSIDAATVHVSSATHRLVRPRGELPARTVVIHGITHDLAAEGRPAGEVLGELLAALAGRVLVGHHVATEVNFLSRACRAHFGAPFVAPAIDTLQLEYAVLRAAGVRPQRGELRLGGARARRGLPRYRAHNALIDALATAELFLAQATDLGAPPLGALLWRGC